jgi:hypothetical protein
MKILEIVQLPDGFDATIDGDNGKHVLHFLQKPDEKEIERAYLTAAAPDKKNIPPPEIVIRKEFIEVMLRFDRLPMAEDVKIAYESARLEENEAIIDFMARPMLVEEAIP